MVFSSTSGLQISIVGPTKYDNLTVRWRVSEYFARDIYLPFATNLTLPLKSLFDLPLQLPNKLPLQVNLPLASIFALI